jgi:hypothetical protein
MLHRGKPIDYHPYGVASLAFQHTHHTVPTLVFPGLLWYIQWFERSVNLLVPWFAALAYMEIPNIPVHVLSHALPLVIPFDQIQRFGLSWISGYW